MACARGLSLYLSLSLLACAGDDLSAGQDSAGGQPGSGGQAGAGPTGGGGGLSGASGQPGAGGAGASGAGASGAGGGGAGSGAGGAGGGQAGSGGQGATSGSSGQGGAAPAGGAGGQAGAPMCMTATDCQPSSDPCAKSLCNAQGLCELVPSNIQPPQVVGDCKQRTCDGATSVFVNKLDDAPDPNGQCDVVSCVDQKPVYTPDSSKCAPGFGCQVSTCVCLGCPSGELPGKPGQCRFGPMTSAYATDDVPSPGPVNLIVDGDLGTTWTSTFSSQYGVGHATVTVQLPEPVWMAELIFYPRYDFINEYEGDPGLQIQGVARTSGGQVAFTINANVPPTSANQPIVIKAPQTVQVKKIEFDVNAYSAKAALHEVAYRACP